MEEVQTPQRRKILNADRAKETSSTKPTPPPSTPYEPPVQKPAVVDISRQFEVRPFLVESSVAWKHPEGFDDLSLQAQVEELLADEENFVVGIGRLRTKRILAYAKRNGVTLEQHVMQIFQASAYEDLGAELVPYVTHNQEDNTYTTQFGVLKGTPKQNAIELAAFIMTSYGSIEKVDPESKFGYVFSPVTEEALLEVLDPQVFTMLDSEGESVFMMLLELSGVYDRKKAIRSAEEALAREAAQEEEEKGKSATPNDDGGKEGHS